MGGHDFLHLESRLQVFKLYASFPSETALCFFFSFLPQQNPLAIFQRSRLIFFLCSLQVGWRDMSFADVLHLPFCVLW